MQPKTVLGIIGASGSGKTTLLRCLNGLERIDGGAIECANVQLEPSLSRSEYGRRVNELRRRIGTVFQHLYLFPHLTALGNIIEAPVHVLHSPRPDAEREAIELLDSVGLKEKARRYPETLSGGEPGTRLLSGLQQPFEPIRRRLDVAVHHPNPFGAGFLNAAVDSPAETGV